MKVKIPQHLKKYIVDQNYKKYTPQDQAVWRYIMKGIRKTATLYGHTGCLTGMKQSGILFEKIPKVSDIDKKLQAFGWRAVTISGFIPPNAFMEFQWNGILPIASELRSIHHISYTPAPDIVHESVGHVPFLKNKTYHSFLKKYAEAVLKSIASVEDKNQYKAIRELSDLKENPKSTNSQVQKAEKKLIHLKKQVSYVSESARLSRFIWWTSEYGLIGSLKNPKMYGAGLISSIQEAHNIKNVKKLWLNTNSLDYSYNITKLQPQLFVIESFSHLQEVLNQVIDLLAWKRGGIYGVEQALKSKTMNTVQLNSGLQISGILEKCTHHNQTIEFLKFKGPCQLAFQDKELPGHSKSYHSEGFSSPLQPLVKNKKPLHLWTESDLKKEGFQKNKQVQLKFKSSIHLQGVLVNFTLKKGRLLLLTFKDCTIKKGDSLLFHPSWGTFDLAIGHQVSSVFAGAADKKSYREEDDFIPSKVPEKSYSQKQLKEFQFLKEINQLKKVSPVKKQKKLLLFIQQLLNKKQAWLESLELFEISKKNSKEEKILLQYIKNQIRQARQPLKKWIQEGLLLYKK